MSHHIGNAIDGRPEGLLRGCFCHASIGPCRTKTAQPLDPGCNRCTTRTKLLQVYFNIGWIVFSVVDFEQLQFVSVTTFMQMLLALSRFRLPE